MKKFLSHCFALLALAAAPLAAYGFGTGMEGCSGDCASCHPITKAEVADILRKVDPAITVLDVGEAPTRGLHQISVKKEGQTGLLYLDYSKKHLFVGSIIDISSRTDLTKKTVEDSIRIDVAKIPLKDALVLGNRKAKKKLYVFSDPECPFCGKLHTELEGLVKEEPDLAIYIILNPLDMHPNAAWKSDAIVCESKKSMAESLRMLEDSFAKKEVKKVSCGNHYSEKMKKTSKELGVGMTPMTVFADGSVLAGFRGKEELRKELAKRK